MAEKESRQALASRAEKMLGRAASSPIAMAARHFRDAGFEVQIGHCYRDARQRFRGIELIARMAKRTPDWELEASWHLAHAPGKKGLLLVLNEADAHSGEPSTRDFRPLANDALDRLLAGNRAQYSGSGLLDAPRLLANGMAEALGKRGADGKSHHATLRALHSAQQALKPTLDTIIRARPVYRFAAPVLVTSAHMYEASVTASESKLVESCFAALQCRSNGSRLVDVVGEEFIQTYARMAGETVSAIPQLLATQTGRIPEPAAAPAPADREIAVENFIDAWDAFREM